MTVFPGLALGLVADRAVKTVRLRRRMRRLPTLPSAPGTGPLPPGWIFVTATGVRLDEATRRAAIAHARSENLKVLDLIPAGLATESALDLLALLDPVAARADRTAPGIGAGHALLLAEEVARRAALPALGRSELGGLDPVQVARLTRRLKLYAADATGHAVAPSLEALPPAPWTRKACLRAMAVPGWIAVLQLAELWPLALVVGVTPVWAVLPILFFCVQPVLVFAGTGARPGDLYRASLLRPAAVLWLRLRVVAGRWRSPAEPGRARLRADFAAAVPPARHGRFEPHRAGCPWCGSPRFSRLLRSRDVRQRKPGHFALDRCANCRHVFQNPRLTGAALDYYLRDASGAPAVPDPRRAAATHRELIGLAGAHTTPRSWLHAGAGRDPDFCNRARGVWPEARFDGLDDGAAVAEPVRRGWIRTGYQDRLHAVAGELAGRYDVVSMHGYLEHAAEPLLELEAAAKVLEPGGHLLVEVPVPGRRLARLAGGLWPAWNQPRCQHFIPAGNLRDAVTGRGLVVVAEGRARPYWVITAMVIAIAGLIAPRTGVPWLKASRVWRWPVLVAVSPVVVAAFVTDLLMIMLCRVRGGAPYRLLARRPFHPDGADHEFSVARRSVAAADHGEDGAASPEGTAARRTRYRGQHRKSGRILGRHGGAGTGPAGGREAGGGARGPGGPAGSRPGPGGAGGRGRHGSVPAGGSGRLPG